MLDAKYDPNDIITHQFHDIDPADVEKVLRQLMTRTRELWSVGPGSDDWQKLYDSSDANRTELKEALRVAYNNINHYIVELVFGAKNLGFSIVQRD